MLLAGFAPTVTVPSYPLCETFYLYGRGEKYIVRNTLGNEADLIFYIAVLLNNTILRGILPY